MPAGCGLTFDPLSKGVQGAVWRFGVARAPSPDVRYGHPWPSLSRTRLRSAFQAPLVGYAGSRSTGDPSLAALSVVLLNATGEEEAGVGERSSRPDRAYRPERPA